MQAFTADQIKYLIHNNGISQAQFARRIGVNQGTVNKWVTGKSVPGNLAMDKIVQEFKINDDA